jgi:hypothetical protein
MTDPQPWPRNCDFQRTEAIRLSRSIRERLGTARRFISQRQLTQAELALADAATDAAEIETAMLKARNGDGE